MPLHSYLVNAGFDVWVMGNRSHDTLALADPSRWIQLDYGDAESVKKFVRDQQFDAVVPGCTDVSMATYTQLEFQPFYRYSPDEDQALGNKQRFRRLCSQLGLPVPDVYPLDELPESGRIICKPADGYSGRGITVFDAADRNQAQTAIQHARANSATGQVVCERFVSGQLYSYTAFLKSQRVEQAFVVREGSRHDTFAVDTSYVDWAFDHALKDSCREAVEAVAEHLGLCDGLVHTQLISDGSNIALVEMSRRCPGDLYSLLIEYSTGFPYAAHYCAEFVGKKINPAKIRKNSVLRHTIKQSNHPYFNGIQHAPLDRVFHIVQTVQTGKRLVEAKPTRVAVAFSEYPDTVALNAAYSNLVMP